LGHRGAVGYVAREQQIEKQSIAAAGNKLGRPGPNNA